MKNIDQLVGINYKNPPKKVKHSKLTRVSDNSIYRSDCPECGVGVLAVSRDPKTFELSENDYCLLCGQHFIYTDVKFIGCDPLKERKEKLKRILKNES